MNLRYYHKDKTIVRPSYLYDKNSYTDNMVSFLPNVSWPLYINHQEIWSWYLVKSRNRWISGWIKVFLWNLTELSTAVLLRHLSDFRYKLIFRDFETSQNHI